MDFSYFDSLLDSIFVIDEDRRVLYCNEAAATLCESSQKRLSKGPFIFDVIQFSDKKLFVGSSGEWGKSESTPYTEVDFGLIKSEKKGKVQIAIQPFKDGNHTRWIVMIHDVTLEEVLHVKYRAELEQKEDVILELKNAQKELEEYSKNLEAMVQERTAEVRSVNRMLNAIMNSLGQGFLVFDNDGICSDVFTKACEQILEGIPTNKRIWDVLKLKGDEREQFEKWVGLAFDETLPFDTLKDLAPNLFNHKEDRHIQLEYYPIRNDDGQVSNLVLVATDKTNEYQANIALDRERQYAQMVVKLVKNKEQFSQFVQNIKTNFKIIDKILLSEKFEKEQIDHLFRILHTLEGEAGAFSAYDVRKASRDCQHVLEGPRSGQKSINKKLKANIAIEVKKLKKNFSLFKNENRDIFSILDLGKSKTYEIPLNYIQNFDKKLNSNVSKEKLQDLFHKTFMWQPIIKYFRHYEDVAKSVAIKQGKKLSPFEFEGEEVLADPIVFEPLFGSFVHAFRNAVDHGIERPDLRTESNKNEFGQIRVSFKNLSGPKEGWLQIAISDDGKGIDPELIKSRAQSLFPEKNIEKLSNDELVQLIFEPGFTSRDEVGEFSGRGVGMDAIRTEAERLGGKAWIQTSPSVGSQLFVEVPLFTSENVKKAS